MVRILMMETQLISKMLVYLYDQMQLLTREDFIEATLYFMWSVAYYTHMLQGVYCKPGWVNNL
jgi:hypothetical protein